KHLRIESRFAILDVGCGGGRTIQKLGGMALEGTGDGIDYASGRGGASRAKNGDLIRSGRVQVQQATVSKLPFPDNRFDLVTAVETQYYWPDLPNDMREILRVMKPGGTLLILAEVYKKGARNKVLRPVMKLLKAADMGVDDQRDLFVNAGF